MKIITTMIEGNGYRYKPETTTQGLTKTKVTNDFFHEYLNIHKDKNIRLLEWGFWRHEELNLRSLSHHFAIEIVAVYSAYFIDTSNHHGHLTVDDLLIYARSRNVVLFESTPFQGYDDTEGKEKRC